MAYGNLRTRPDLSPLFGPMSREEEESLLDTLLQIDDRLDALAQEASERVGQRYTHAGLGLFVGEKYSEIAGGPSGRAGDIWFEIGYTFDESSRKWRVPPWTVDSRIIIFCADGDLVVPGDSCTHDLVCLVAEAATPMATVQALAAHVDALGVEVRTREPDVFTKSLHCDSDSGEGTFKTP